MLLLVDSHLTTAGRGLMAIPESFSMTGTIELIQLALPTASQRLTRSMIIRLEISGVKCNRLS
jgi:hypothetical protein